MLKNRHVNVIDESDNIDIDMDEIFPKVKQENMLAFLRTAGLSSLI